MEAFSVFVQHWLIEENQIKTQMREAFRLRRQVACESLLLDRRINYAFRVIMETILEIEMSEENQDDFEELYELAERLAVDVVVHNVVHSVCDKCHSGIVRFRVVADGRDLMAVCGNCDEAHMHLMNIFPDN